MALTTGTVRQIETDNNERSTRDTSEPNAAAAVPATSFGTLFCHSDCAALVTTGSNLPLSGQNVNVVQGAITVANAVRTTVLPLVLLPSYLITGDLPKVWQTIGGVGPHLVAVAQDLINLGVEAVNATVQALQNTGAVFGIILANGLTPKLSQFSAQPGTPVINIPSVATGTVTGTLGFTDPIATPLTYTVTTQPSEGVVTVSSAGVFTYTPFTAERIAVGITGATISDVFAVTAADGLGPDTTEAVTVPVSPATISLADTITGVGHPNGVALTADGKNLYVSGTVPNPPGRLQIGVVSQIDTATDTVTGSTVTDNGTYGPAFGIAVNSTGTTVYATSVDGGRVYAINTADHTYTTVSVGTHPYGVAVSPDGTLAYVTNFDDNTVSVINTATKTVTDTISNVGENPIGVAFSPDGRYAYVADNLSPAGNGDVSVINTKTKTLTTTIPVGVSPDGVAISPNGKLVYVANQEDNTVSVINTATDAVTATVAVGAGPYAVAFSPDSSVAYVTNFDDGSVSLIYTATNAVADTISVGAHPISVAVSPDGSRIYVANQSDSTVSVIYVGGVTTTPPTP